MVVQFQTKARKASRLRNILEKDGKHQSYLKSTMSKTAEVVVKIATEKGIRWVVNSRNSKCEQYNIKLNLYDSG